MSELFWFLGGIIVGVIGLFVVAAWSMYHTDWSDIWGEK